MSVTTRLLTAGELDQFPDDGKRREVIAGVLYESPAPGRRHQELSSHLQFLLYQAFVQSGSGMVFTAPVDVRVSVLDQVQPAILAIRNDRLDIYRGSTVHGAPDIVVKILSPSNPSYEKSRNADFTPKPVSLSTGFSTQPYNGSPSSGSMKTGMSRLRQ